MLYIRKNKAKSGILSFCRGGVIYLVTVSCFGSWFLMKEFGYQIYQEITGRGEHYISNVVHLQKSKTSYRSGGRYSRTTTTYFPVVRFKTNEGHLIIKKLTFSTSKVKIGDTYRVNYDERTGKVIVSDYTLVIKVVIAFILCFITTVMLLGAVLYILGVKMENYYKYVPKISFSFFVPFLMIIFDTLLICGLFYGNEVPIWARVLLVFFIITISLTIFWYLKTLIMGDMFYKKNKIKNIIYL